MRNAQIVYKVDNLSSAVSEAKKKGYCVEYGGEKNPYNAFIYFENGPFIELMQNTGVPGFVKVLFKIFRMKGFANRFETWDNASHGPLGIGIEVEDEKIDRIRNFLKAKGIASYKVPVLRKDVNGEKNTCYALFPENVSMPFYVTKYVHELKRDNTNHPNGVKCVKCADICIEDPEYEIVNKLFQEMDLFSDLGGTLVKKKGVFQLQMNKEN